MRFDMGSRVGGWMRLRLDGGLGQCGTEEDAQSMGNAPIIAVGPVTTPGMFMKRNPRLQDCVV